MGTVVGPILQRRKPRLMQIVWFTQSHKSAPLPILTPSPQLPESCEEGNLEPGPHQRGSPRQPLPDWGPHALSLYQSRVAGDWKGPALTRSLSGFIGGGLRMNGPISPSRKEAENSDAPRAGAANRSVCSGWEGNGV